MKPSPNIVRSGTTQRWSDLVTFNGIAYFVEVPDDPSLEPKEQFLMVFAQVDRRLALIDVDKKSLIQVLIYLPDHQDLDLFNTLWDQWIPEGHAPVRACIHAPLAATGYRVELVITAAAISNEKPI